MPRLIFKCLHIKGGERAAAHLSNYVKYAATRDGVERIAKRENYVDYIASRPRVQKVGEHGLFTAGVEPLVLSKVADEVAHHPGTVWLPILSLRREDAQRLGYNNARRWQMLLTTLAPDMAKAMKIPREQFRWYAAFHDEGSHPHVHMVCYSADGKSGFLSRQGIEKIKSKLANEIFRQDMIELYQRQTMRRNKLTAQSRERMKSLIQEMKSGTLENQRMGQLMVSLAQQLQSVGGRKQYGYLKAPLKALVDEIVDELAKDSRVSEAYSLWYEQREEILRSYKDNLPERLPLSQQKELKQVKNIVIQEAVKMNGPRPPEPVQESDPAEELTSLPEAPTPDSIPSEDEEPLPNADWTEEYKLARALLYGSEDTPPDFKGAYELFHREAQRGNALAMCDLGRMCADGLGREADTAESHQWYAKALSAFLELEEWEPNRYTEYRIGKLYAGGMGTEQDHATAAEWLMKSAEQGHKYARYSLAGLYLRGQGVDKDVEKAHQLYKASASQGAPYAAYELGKLYRDGLGCKKDGEEARRWFQSAYNSFTRLEAQSHDDKLQYRLGWMLFHGVGTGRDEQAAREWFQRSAKLGNPHAQYQLAKLILAGSGSSAEQVQTAVEWLIKAAETGQDCAQYALGKLYRDSIGVEKDMLQAVAWFALAAEQNNSYAAYALGKLYLEGEEVPMDMEKALRWLRRSAELGNQFAQYRLGRLLLTGEDTPKDVTEAMRFLTASADQGNQYAQYQLGKLYLLGYEVDRDEEAAVQWFKLSADQGNEYAHWFLDHLHEFDGPSPAECVVQLLHHMSRIFQQQSQRQAGMRMDVDRKLRQKIREKKIAMGHRPDDHIGSQGI